MTSATTIRMTMIIAAAVVVVALPAFAQSDHYVDGYTRQNGTYVPPHYQTNPDNTLTNNWSTRGNTNPFTGQAGTQSANPNANDGSVYGGGSAGANGGSNFGGNASPNSIYGGNR
jgi:hypothetical protein